MAKLDISRRDFIRLSGAAAAVAISAAAVLVLGIAPGVLLGPASATLTANESLSISQSVQDEVVASNSAEQD